MAQHSTPASMLKESLDELVEAAILCLAYKKTDAKWGKFKTGGCLGFPGAMILFSIIDTIGSYYRKNKTFKIKLDGQDVYINSDGWEHFKILNSKYFKQSLSNGFIQALYNKFRSNLTHNAVLGKDTTMFSDEMIISPISYQSKAFATSNQNGNTIFLVSLRELLQICIEAVNLFKKDIDEIVPKSTQGKDFH